MFGTQRNEPAGFRSQRSVVLARRGMVCTSQPLASAAGLAILRRGGNAVDAAVCAAAVLGVVEPFMTGVGGDCFMLIWNAADAQLYGLNGSGRAPAGLSLEVLRERGLGEMPMQGILSVTIPGAVDAWCQALARFGTCTIADVLPPAIEYAQAGFPVSEIIAHQWNLLVQLGVLQEENARRTFTLDGRAPRLGEVFRAPALARTLQEIAAGGAAAFYRGPLAEQIVAFSRANGGVHRLDDFATHQSTWVVPIGTGYRGYELYELPPNGQGLAALIALNILENFDLAAHPLDSAACAHLRIEAIKLAFADRGRYIADPEQAHVPVATLLSKDYAHGRAALIHMQKALKRVAPGVVPTGGDTVYLTTADAQGNVVSLINSLYFPFGSGLVAGDTGIVLQNRGYGFVTDPGHPNCVAPRKRPFHTIIPAMLCRQGRPVVSFGVMGGDVQPQGHLQVVSNLVDYGLNIQEALDYPRFRFLDTDRVALEGAAGVELTAGLAERGHAVVDEQVAMAMGGFGGGQGIMIDADSGCYWGGSDRRKDGCAIGH
jgi:gamma-glutamyltranspeptidase/glutathione hydrolase